MKSSQKIHLAKLSEWSVRFQEQTSSGLSIKEWCSRNDVSLYAFQYWKRVAKEAYLDSLIPEIVQISEAPAPATPVQPPADLPACSSDEFRNSRKLYNSDNSDASDPQPISLSLGDVRIEFGTSSTDEDIFRILKAVRHA